MRMRNDTGLPVSNSTLTKNSHRRYTRTVAIGAPLPRGLSRLFDRQKRRRSCGSRGSRLYFSGGCRFLPYYGESIAE